MSELMNIDQTYIANTYARFPVEIASGKGSLLYSPEGKRYIDMGSGIGVTAFGSGDETWKEAVIAQLLRIIRKNPEGCNRITLCRSKRCAAAENRLEIFKSGILQCESKERILDDGILHFLLAHLCAKRRILLHGNALVINKDARFRVLQALRQRIDNRLLLFQSFGVRHVFHLHNEIHAQKKNLCLSEDDRGNKHFVCFPRQDLQLPDLLSLERSHTVAKSPVFVNLFSQ